jgi:hypothetical protein
MTPTVKRLALSLTGSGHLMTYQLGACQVLLKGDLPIAAISGSSGGAIAATVVCCIPNRLEDYASQFIQKKGHGFSILQTMLQEESCEDVVPTTLLSICLTRCRDGAPILKTFHSPLTNLDHDLLPTIAASCEIPPSFHPWDLFGSHQLWYPEGIVIDGESYVDGGIAAPAPPVQEPYEKVIVSPISGGYDTSTRISPKDSSFQLPFCQLTARGGFRIRPSVQNLRALRASSGMTSSYELQMYYDWGKRDAIEFLDNFRGNGGV